MWESGREELQGVSSAHPHSVALPPVWCGSWRKHPLRVLREDAVYPNYMREMRTILLAARAMTHRVEPCRTYY